MKASLFVAAGVALAAAAYWVWQAKAKPAVNVLPEKENQRHHLTNIFSRAKEVALGN